MFFCSGTVAVGWMERCVRFDFCMPRLSATFCRRALRTTEKFELRSEPVG